MNPLPIEFVDQKPQRTIGEEEEDSLDSFSTLSDYDFVEFRDWDAKFNQQGKPGEVPPPSDARPSHVWSSGDSKPKSSNAVPHSNGRMGCKQLAVLQRQLLLKKTDKHTRDDEDDDSDHVQIVPSPPAKRQCFVPTNPHDPKDESFANGCEIVGSIPGVQLPHPRHGCTHHRFEFYDAEKRDISWTERTEVNKEHCLTCYCYVCEVKADQCSDFGKHCNANDRDSMKSYWKYQRHRMKEEKSNRHFRYQCAVHIFRSQKNNTCPWPVEMWEQRSWFNKRFCRDCVCFVCNVPVLECPEWSEHCK